MACPETETYIGKELWSELDEELFSEGRGKPVVAERGSYGEQCRCCSDREGVRQGGWPGQDATGWLREFEMITVQCRRFMAGEV